MSEPEGKPTKIRRALLGYRVKQVDAMLAEREERIEEGEREVEYVRQVLSEREREIEAVQREAEDARRRADEAVHSLTVLGQQLHQVQGQARADAERIRQEATADAERLGQQLSQLVRVRDEIAARLRGSLEDAGKVIAGIGGGASAEDLMRRYGLQGGGIPIAFPRAPAEQPPEPAPLEQPPPEQPAQQTPPAPQQEPPAPPAQPPQATEAPPAAPVVEGTPREPQTQAPPAPAAAEEAPAPNGSVGPYEAQVFEGTVKVDIGPLEDFAQLSRFEDATADISASREVSIERFSGGRATIAIQLEQPVALLAELLQRSPLNFTVREQSDEGLVLDIVE